MWATDDAFHYVWKRVSGDVAITADIAWDNTSGNPHKKAVLVMRQSLDGDSAYADAAAHGDGTFSLQARDEKGAATHEVQANAPRPTRLRLQKIGEYFYMLYATEGEDLKLSGGSLRVALREPFYVGIGVCAHDPEVVEAATFSNVSIVPGTPKATRTETAPLQHLETVSLSSTDRRTVQVLEGRPSRRPGRSTTCSSTATATAVSHSIAGGSPQPSMPVAGRVRGTRIVARRQLRLLHRRELRDRCTSGASALMAASRRDDVRRVGNWFPHPSPDGFAWSFCRTEGASRAALDRLRDVMLRVMTLADRKITVLARDVRRPGTIDLPSWSPDSRRLAFVSYLLLP